MTEKPKNEKDWVDWAGDIGAVAIICMAVAIVVGVVIFIFKLLFHF
jgi:hypothetical protein